MRCLPHFAGGALTALCPAAAVKWHARALNHRIAVAPLSLNCHCELVALVVFSTISPCLRACDIPFRPLHPPPFSPPTRPAAAAWTTAVRLHSTAEFDDAALTPHCIPVRCIYAQADHLGIFPFPLIALRPSDADRLRAQFTAFTRRLIAWGSFHPASLRRAHPDVGRYV
ncbi:hypothetical protein BDW22DRAFT_1488603 [Trametopsis cervina]|nr:hypothetical protein BDW22DRAFT_1488603 [Trametopsis cervina]